MNINLYKDYWVRTDPMNYIFYKKQTVQDKKSKRYGEVYEDVIGYFGTLQGVLTDLCREEIRASKCTTINGLLKDIKRMEKVVEELANSIGVDNIVERVIKQSKEFLAQGEAPVEDKPKRGRKKKM